MAYSMIHNDFSNTRSANLAIEYVYILDYNKAALLASQPPKPFHAL